MEDINKTEQPNINQDDRFSFNCPIYCDEFEQTLYCWMDLYFDDGYLDVTFCGDDFDDNPARQLYNKDADESFYLNLKKSNPLVQQFIEKLRLYDNREINNGKLLGSAIVGALILIFVFWLISYALKW